MGTIVTLTGPTCSGKSTLEKLLKAKGFAPLISTTTREPRFGEKNGESYYFITKAEFEAGVERGDFAEFVRFNGLMYGLSAAEIESKFKQGKPVVAVVEPHGRNQLAEFAKKNGHHLFRVYVDATWPVIAERFLRRFVADWTLSGAMNSYARRLATIIETETAWVKEALESDKPPYDYWAANFGPETEKMAVENILLKSKLGRSLAA